MNILTFDIEEWYIEKAYYGDRKEKYAQYDRLLDHILKILDSNRMKATFFCLGKIAEEFPHVIAKIASCGHEIGSHSYAHQWVNKMTPDEFRIDTKRAISALEDVSGQKVVSFRAPAFSIGESNKWAIDVLVENGIENDASVFPGVRDFGGFSSFATDTPCHVEYNGVTINEFPIPMCRLPILGRSLAYSGGGYFRLLPLAFVEKRMRQSSYNMCYFHILDLLSEKSAFMSRNDFETYFKEPGTLKNRISRYVKSNIGRNNAVKNFDALVSSFPFTSIRGYLSKEEITPVVRI